MISCRYNRIVVFQYVPNSVWAMCWIGWPDGGFNCCQWALNCTTIEEAAAAAHKHAKEHKP